MKNILGIEGGGTKTEWVYIQQPGEPPRRGKLPAGNLRLVSDEVLEQMLRVLPREAERVGVFLAGCVTPADHQRLEAIVARVWPEARRAIGSDRESGFAAAFHGRDGIAVIAGTGSAITGRLRGHYEKAGGWGHLLGDKGSGYDIAMQALRAVLWQYDLTQSRASPAVRFLAALGLNRLEDLVAWAKEADKMSVARLASVVFEAAAEGDVAMAEVLESGACALADGTAAVAGRLGLKAPEVRLQGGLFVHHADYARRFAARLATLLPGANVSVSETSGADGALWLAAEGRESLKVPEERVLAALAERELAGMQAAHTERVNPRSRALDIMSTEEMIDLFITEERSVEEALRGARGPLAEAVDLVSGALLQGGRLFYVGAGTSGRLGVLDASEIPPTFGAPPEQVQAIMAGGAPAIHRAVEGAEDEREGGELAMLERGVAQGDVVCGIAASGRTPFVLGALGKARALGAATVLLTCNPARPRQEEPWEPWDVEIDLEVGPEIVTGSTRLKAGTATKVALNMLSTGAMVRLGRTRGNLMAKVQVSNAKLRDRAIRLVSGIRQISREEAEAELIRHGWDVARCLPDGEQSQ